MNTDSNIINLDLKAYIRRRPGMVVGKIGDGRNEDDGIYVLVKEIINNSVDEFRLGFGKEIIINLNNDSLTIRDFGRGIDFDRLAHFYQKLVNVRDKEGMVNRSVGAFGLGLIIVASLSSEMEITSYQHGLEKTIILSQENNISINEQKNTSEPDGLRVRFTPDNQIFGDYAINANHILEMVKVYAVCNPGLSLKFGRESFYAPQGMLNLLENLVGTDYRSTAVHIVDNICDLAIAPMHIATPPIIKSFVNGQPTTLGGQHEEALTEVLYSSLKRILPESFLNYNSSANLIICFNIVIDEPIFYFTTRTRLTSCDINRDGKTIKQYFSELIEANLHDMEKAWSAYFRSTTI